MGRIAAVVLVFVLGACGGGGPRAAASPSPVPATPQVSPTPQPTPIATPYPPKAEGFASKVLVEKPRNLAESFTGFVWIAPAAPGLAGVSGAVSDTESFSAAYEKAAIKSATSQWPSSAALYATPEFMPLPAGNYTESLRHVIVQASGRSSAHKHSGLEAVLVLEGTVLIRSGMGAPTVLTKGQGFYILPNMPIQLINAGTGVARTLVYSISPAGQPFTTELDESP